jgi:hypothetical protein
MAKSFFDQVGLTSRDFMVIEPCSIGDVYHTLCVLESFREKYVEAGTRLAFCCKASATPLVAMFHVAERTVTVAYEERLYESFAQRYLLSAGVPIVTVPQMYGSGWLGRLIGDGYISPLIARKLILGLELDSTIRHPVISEAAKGQAARNAAAHGVELGRSLLICNHAITFTALPVECFEAVVRNFPGPVFTDMIAGSIQPIPGTRPITIPIDQLAATAEAFGTVLALRSGIVEVLSNSPIRLFSIYPRITELNPYHPDRVDSIRRFRLWTLAWIGLSKPSFENTIYLEDSDGVAEISERIARALRDGRQEALRAQAF